MKYNAKIMSSCKIMYEVLRGALFNYRDCRKQYLEKSYFFKCFAVLNGEYKETFAGVTSATPKSRVRILNSYPLLMYVKLDN